MADLERLRIEVEKKLTARRYRHSLNVQRQAVRLAKLYGADWYRAGIAGLVHDICKDMTEREQLKYMRSHGILLDDLTRKHPKLWHAVAGSVYIRDELGIEDEAIQRAVRWHTTGKADMTTLEIAVYLADWTSEDREFENAEVMRRLAESDPVAAMRQGILFSINEVVSEGKTIVENAWEAYNFYITAPDAPVERENGR